MKLLLLLSVLFLAAIPDSEKKIDYSICKNYQVKGIYIFIKSIPIAKYKVIGSVDSKYYLNDSDKKNFINAGSAQLTSENYIYIDSLVTRCNRYFQEADAIIIHDLNFLSAEVIKF